MNSTKQPKGASAFLRSGMLLKRRRTISLSCLLALMLALSLSVPTAVATPASSPSFDAAVSLDSGINTSATAEIVDKDEVIYGLLEYDGSVDQAYVVNHFRLSSEGSFSDSGAYSEVSNLTNTEALSLDGDEVGLAAAEGDFYYQGTLKDPRLPWDISLSYTLDGKPVASSEVSSLAGQSGNLGIAIKTSATSNADKSFYEHYTLQLTVTLPSENISNLTAEGATIASAGSNTQVNFMVLPESDEDYELTVDFETINMPGISVAAVPFGMSFDLPDTSSVSGDLGVLVSAIAELSAGTQQLSSGSAQAASGLGQLSSGSSAFNQGLSQLSSGSSELVASSGQLSGSLAQTAGALQLLSQSPDIQALPDATREQLLALIGATGEISGGYTALNSGIQQYTAGVDALAGQYPGIDSGIAQSAQGLAQLNSGINQLSSGTGELYQSIQTMPEEMQKRIDEYAAAYDFAGFEPHSFVSDKNTQVSRVQFVLTTPALELPAEDTDEGTVATESTFLDRLFALFKPEE